jgi:prevent-host-death family protein
MKHSSAVGSRTATVVPVETIPQKELRNNIGEVLRRAEAGERITITVSGRPVAELGPTRKRQWVESGELHDLWTVPADTALDRDLAAFPAGLSDPWAT